MKERPGLTPEDHPVVGEKLYTTDEVAELFKVTPYTVRNWIKAGRVKALKHGKSYKITQTELTRLATSNF